MAAPREPAPRIVYLALIAMNLNTFPFMGRILYGYRYFAILDCLFSHTSGRLSSHVDSMYENRPHMSDSYRIALKVPINIMADSDSRLRTSKYIGMPHFKP